MDTGARAQRESPTGSNRSCRLDSKNQSLHQLRLSVDMTEPGEQEIDGGAIELFLRA